MTNLHRVERYTGEGADWDDGMSQQGVLDVGYGELVAAWGQPEEDPHDKSQAEWTLSCPDGSVVIVHGKEYDKEDVREWHVVGKPGVMRWFEDWRTRESVSC